MKELEKNILGLFRSYDIPIDKKNLVSLIRTDKLESLSPQQLQRYFKEKYDIRIKYKDAEELEIMILTHSYTTNRYTMAS